MAETGTSTAVTVTEGNDSSPEQIAGQFGPFQPPPDHSFGEEFEPPAPRPIPAVLKEGSYRRKADRHAFTLLLFGGLCVLYAGSRYVKELAYYFLPLGYLQWIGWGLAALGVGTWLAHRLRKGLYAYVVDGIPVVARVLRTTRVQEQVHGHNQLRFAALIEYQDPATGKLCYKDVLTGRITGGLGQAKFDLALKPGEYITAVGRSESFQYTLTPYGFLGLHPRQEAILHEGRPWHGMSTWGAISVALLSMLLIGLVLAFLYIVEFCLPTGDMTAAGVAAGLGAVPGLCIGWVAGRRAVRSARKRLGAALGGLLLGAAAGFCTAGLVNAAFDGSPPEYREVAIQQFWQTTHHGIFRSYSIDYCPFPGGTQDKIAARLDKMQQFNLRFGALEFGKGALGMRWIRDIHPLRLVLLPDAQPDQEDVITTEVEVKGEGKKKLNFILCFNLGGGRTLKPTRELVAAVRKQVFRDKDKG